MIEILESAEVRQRALPISVSTWHWMIAHGLVSQRAELIRGVIVEKMSKSSLHVFLNQQLFNCFTAAGLKDYVIRKEDPLTLKDSEPEPDISIVPGTLADYRHQHPQTAHLVVEVAVSSEASDREMVRAYAEAGIPECWLVLAKSQTVEQYTNLDGGNYANCLVVERGQKLKSTAFPSVEIDLDSLFG